MKKVLKKKRFYLLLLCLFLFLLIAILILKNGVLNIDTNSYDFFKKNLINESLTPYIKLFTNLGGALLLVLFTLIITFFIKNKKISLAIILNLIIIFLINEGLKIIFGRVRPDTINWLVNERGYSFPSGHSAVSMAYYGFLIYLVYTNFKNNKCKWLLIFILSFIILFIGFSRIYLGVHYLSDVLGGFIFSIFYLVIFIYFYNKFVEL